MKKALVPLLALALLLAGCADSKYLQETGKPGIKYPAYGIINESTSRSRHVCYEVSPGSVIVAIIFVETIIVPVYVVGWDLFEPVRLKNRADDDCTSFD